MRYNIKVHVRFEILIAVKVSILVLWLVKQRDPVRGYRHFGGPCRLSLWG
jgi:hypothetical protein